MQYIKSEKKKKKPTENDVRTIAEEVEELVTISL